MMFRPIGTEIYLTAMELDVEFDDYKSNGKGTGFVVKTPTHCILCIARHVVDKSYLPPGARRETRARQLSVKLLAHQLQPDKSFKLVPTRFTIDNKIIPIFHDEQDADIALVDVTGALTEIGKSCEISTIDLVKLGNAQQLFVYPAGTPAYFVGYPELAPTAGSWPLEDGKTAPLHHPLVRQGIFSSLPAYMYQLDGLLGGHAYGLLHSFALNGFSGAPLFIPQDGWETAAGDSIQYTEFKPSILAGMVCGHFNSSADRSNGSHSGLSYFVSSVRIRQSIDRAFRLELSGKFKL